MRSSASSPPLLTSGLVPKLLGGPPPPEGGCWPGGPPANAEGLQSVASEEYEEEAKRRGSEGLVEGRGQNAGSNDRRKAAHVIERNNHDMP